MDTTEFYNYYVGEILPEDIFNKIKRNEADLRDVYDKLYDFYRIHFYIWDYELQENEREDNCITDEEREEYIHERKNAYNDILLKKIFKLKISNDALSELLDIKTIMIKIPAKESVLTHSVLIFPFNETKWIDYYLNNCQVDYDSINQLLKTKLDTIRTWLEILEHHTNYKSYLDDMLANVVDNSEEYISREEFNNYLQAYPTFLKRYKQLKIYVKKIWNYEMETHAWKRFLLFCKICRFGGYDKYLATYLANELTEPEDPWEDL